MQDPMFFNKLAAAMLVALLLFFGLPQLATALRGGHHGAGHLEEGAHPFPQYPIEYATSANSGGETGPELSFEEILAKADPKAGERRAALCKSCHTLEKGGANGTGPNLWGVLGRPLGTVAGFNYTGALKAVGGAWGFDNLQKYLENSQGFIPGTAMVQRFPKAEQRAELLVYLNTLSDAPLPLPTPAPAAEAPAAASPTGAAPADAAPAEDHGQGH